MKYPGFIVATLSLLLIFVNFSCKKGTIPNLSTIKIATVDESEPGGVRYHYFIFYDMYNNVDSISKVGGGIDTGYSDYYTFNYVGSSFIINDGNVGPITVDANTNGQILKILVVDSVTMYYNGSELTELKYATSPSRIYQWDNNGDIASDSLAGGVADTYYYDLSRNGQIGDALRIDNFLQYGRSYITTNYLPDELGHNGIWIEEDLYQFDDKGRISQLKRIINGNANPNDTTTYAYTYY
jgi:hypothetical protein